MSSGSVSSSSNAALLVDNAPPLHEPLAGEPSSTAARQAPTAARPSMMEMVLSNPMFSAGLGLVGAGAGLALARRGLISLSTLAQRRLLTTLEIPSTDKSHPWVLEWISRQKSPFSRPSAAGPGAGFRSHQLSVNTNVIKKESGATEVQFAQVPGEGTHFIRYRGAWMQVKRERNSRMIDVRSGLPWERVSLTTLSRDASLFDTILHEAYELGALATEGKTTVYSAWGTEWRPLGPARRKRVLDSVVLAKGVKERIVADVKTFVGRERWYADRGIPYRRGYLLSGPPGSGKSSFVQALAGSLSLDICMLNLSERGQTDDKLMHLLINAPPRSVVLLEDVDAAFQKRIRVDSDGYQSGITFSGLLNALDGVAAAESRILFLTTNHPERLDPALIRPGRVDLHETLGDARPEQARELFERFYAEYAASEDGEGNEQGRQQVEECAERLEKLVKGRDVSMAQLQGLFIVNAESPEGAVTMLEEQLQQKQEPI